MMIKLIGIIVILLSIWQFYAFRKSFREFKAYGNKSTSIFVALAVWDGLFFGIILLFGGLGLLFS